MTQLWMHLLLSAVILIAAAFVIATVAARIRFSASRKLRWVLDILFALSLLLPFRYPEESILISVDSIMLPIFYFCAVMGFQKVNREVLEAARLQGMGICGTFWRFFIPSAKYWLLGGVAFVLARILSSACLLLMKYY